MKPLFIALALCFGMFSYSFSQEIEWQNTIGGSTSDYLTSMQQTTDGGYILGGSSVSNISGDKIENCLGTWDIWILKTDFQGNIQWQNTIGGTNGDILNSIEQTTDGGYVLGVTSWSNISGDKAENSIGNDYWIIKTDSIGNILWQNTIGGSGNDLLSKIQQTQDGGFIIGGYSDSNTSVDKLENSIGGKDYWIVKIDSIGNIQWQNSIGGDLDDILISVQQTTDMGYILGGTSVSNISGDKTENNLGGIDFWILKTDSLGNIQWQNTIGGSLADDFLSIQETLDGGYIIGGSSESDISGDKTVKKLGHSDYWIIKIDVLGNILWQKAIGGAGGDYLNALQPTVDGGYILCGQSGSNISGNKTEYELGFNDIWVVKINSIGDVEWENTIGGARSDIPYAIGQSTDGGFYLGATTSSNISVDKTENCIGVKDYWIIKLTGKYNLVSGKLYSDINSNEIQDTLEPSLSNRMVIEQNSGRIAFSDQNGSYSLSVLDSGNFLSYPAPLNLYTPAPATHSSYFSGLHQKDTLIDFAFQAQGIFDDIAIVITPLGNFRSGFNACYRIDYFNYGTTTVAPAVVIYPDNNLVYLNASVSPFFNSQDSIVWNLPSFGPFQSGSIIVNFRINLGIPIGTMIFSTTHIYPYDSDVNQSNNNGNWEVYTTGSIDPNDMLVSDDTLTTTQLNNSPWLDYIVRFQNTGNDTAFTVKILNPIDTTKLDISSIEFVNSSHPVNLNWINYQRNMEFKFDNILLPDSNVNEPLSHGFVHYRIKPKTNLVVGDTVKNFAAIYFDFNEPVITNKVNTVIVSPTGLPSLSSLGKLLVYPNPAQSKININGINLENGKAQLRIFDICEKIILEKIITSANPDIDIQNLPSGMYLLQLGNQRATFVKQ